ncbi:unnamed protein product [Discula destructiva]
MKPSTPRKSRRRNHVAGSSNVVPISDYESDAPDAQASAAFASSATAVESNVQAVQNTQTTNPIGAMNLSVLQRYHPTIQSCIPGPPTTVYAWDAESDSWGEKLGLGALFVCDQYTDISAGQPLPRPCIFILNRKGPENFFFDLSNLIGLHQADHETDHGTKLMIQIPLIHSDNSDESRLWGLLGDLEPMKAAYAAIQEKVNEMNAARSQAR